MQKLIQLITTAWADQDHTWVSRAENMKRLCEFLKNTIAIYSHMSVKQALNPYIEYDDGEIYGTILYITMKEIDGQARIGLIPANAGKTVEECAMIRYYATFADSYLADISHTADKEYMLKQQLKELQEERIRTQQQHELYQQQVAGELGICPDELEKLAAYDFKEDYNTYWEKYTGI